MSQILAPGLVRVEADCYWPEITVESRSYIQVRVDKSVHDLNLYWQLVDPEFSLLELGFNPDGRMVSLSIPLFNGNVGRHDTRFSRASSHGTPIFELKPWRVGTEIGQSQETILKTLGRIEIDRYRNALVITVTSEAIASAVLSGGNLLSCFDAKNRLCCVGLLKESAPSL